MNISISSGSPISATSYADLCYNASGLTDASIYSSACYCVGLSECGNTECVEDDIDGDGIPDAEILLGDEYTLHHKNVYNMLHNITPPNTKSTTKLMLTGHSTCVATTSYCLPSENELYGLAYFHRRICIISEKRSLEHEKVTAIHEFGHLLGIKDHYAEQPEDSKYSDNCIYGSNHSNYTTASSIIICGGCRQDITDAIEIHDTYFK